MHVSESNKRDGSVKETGEMDGKESDEGPQILGRSSLGAASQTGSFNKRMRVQEYGVQADPAAVGLNLWTH
jgi:hypothetical protein